MIAYEFSVADITVNNTPPSTMEFSPWKTRGSRKRALEELQSEFQNHDDGKNDARYRSNNPNAYPSWKILGLAGHILRPMSVEDDPPVSCFFYHSLHQISFE